MRTYIGGQEAVSVNEFIELALGTPLELWLGVEGRARRSVRPAWMRPATSSPRTPTCPTT